MDTSLRDALWYERHICSYTELRSVFKHILMAGSEVPSVLTPFVLLFRFCEGTEWPQGKGGHTFGLRDLL